MIKVKEKVAAAVGVATLFLTIMVGYANVQADLSRMGERVDNLHSTNTQTLDVLNRLATSVDRLSQSVARLDERTRYLERESER